MGRRYYVRNKELWKRTENIVDDKDCRTHKEVWYRTENCGDEDCGRTKKLWEKRENRGKERLRLKEGILGENRILWRTVRRRDCGRSKELWERTEDHRKRGRN